MAAHAIKASQKETSHSHAMIEAKEEDDESDADSDLLAAVAKDDSVSGTGRWHDT